ncbi:hypothetical protein B0T26DRAFT_745917 [Lasiosphaeria miniovina]|uniref:SnoaL-like domain-containing protein n=1 Tax=Lasiosphaeria miniovina TaxID=1954250 RepID=A0AA40ED46_9PEZI|nr:uncharacterized protein B0T26DRAFT_745917 [Lasiosphaeria miniovina]KAK0733942.1 hypothetical protein B0T26DRAFT_745917 [Lasiosphaeria miniovina]
MAASSYSVQQYLLDRANIHDIVTKLNFARLASEVYAAEALIDCTSVLGGEPETVSTAEWIAAVLALTFDAYASTQYLQTDASPSSITKNAGLLQVKLGRDVGLEEKGDNPWRITKVKLVKRWGQTELHAN